MEVIMSEYKKGDVVELECDINMHFPKGMIMSVSYATDKHIQLQAKIKVKDYNIKKVGECEMNYETSNRKKLHDHIKASGHTSSELGEVMGSKWNFSNITKKSRFDKFGDISEKSLNDSKFLVNSIITGLNKKSDNVEAETDSEFQFSSDEFDFKFDIPEEKSQDASVFEDNYPLDTDTRKSSGTGASQSKWIALNKIAFAICFTIVILLISILYFVVSK